MGDVYGDGTTRVAYVPSIASIAAPTVAELNAGTLLQSYVTPDGLVGFEATTAEVDTSSLASTFDTKGIGRDSFSGTMLRLKKQSGVDTPYGLMTRGTEGYIVIRRWIPETTAWAAAQKVEVYPIVCGRERLLPAEANSVSKYEVPTMVRSAPELRATVA